MTHMVCLRHVTRALVAAVAFACVVGDSGRAVAQGQESPRADTIGAFIDCDWCDQQFLRSDITFVNHLRDAKDADVHVLVTTRDTGGGGTEFTLEFIGLRSFAGVSFKLTYFEGTSDTSDTTRKGLAQTLRLGLVRYVATTPLAANRCSRAEATADRSRRTASPNRGSSPRG